MGVPAFYRWLVDKYEQVVVDAVEEEPAVIDGFTMPLDTSQPNPNGTEFDNLYLDMNAIIHPCFHPEERPSPTTFDEVFQGIFDYIDRVFGIVRPRKLLYMAIDGVAPRAKMNQQRSRRFRTAKDAAVAADEEERLRAEFEQEGRKLPPKTESQFMDSNVITPGTQFMSFLSTALQCYIHRRLNADPGWKDIKVILSDSNVPGEGEHKIMSYIRLQRNLPGYNPNTRHCIYGSDADLIMLALATHEIHFSVLREVGSTPKFGNAAPVCEENLDTSVPKTPHQFLNIWTLRDYLELGMSLPDLPFKIDLERVVDDFVLMCFFAGNDFLPHMPTLDIREGAIDLLIAVYKKELRAMGGYLSNGSKLNMTRLERFIKAVGSYEDKIFQKRAVKRAERARREKLQLLNEERTLADEKEYFIPVKRSDIDACALPDRQYHSGTSGGQSQLNFVASRMATLDIRCNPSTAQEADNWKVLKSKLKEVLRQKADMFNMENPAVDKVRLGDPGWKERYYEQKFDATHGEIDDIKKNIVLKYMEGLCWVMHYYYEGVCSWCWFYPYHYAPFASDLKGIGRMKVDFEFGQPFKPFNQLLAVFPAASAHALPEEYRKLMTDPQSPMIDFYPSDFEVDMDGKRYTWQGVAKLPFIDENRLLAEVAKIEHTQTEEEAKRNSVMHDMLFVSGTHKLSSCIVALAHLCKNMTEGQISVRQRIDPIASDGMNGYISVCEGDLCPSVFNNGALSSAYHLPDAHEHIARPPEGVEFPEKTMTEDGIETDRVFWHEDSIAGGRRFDNGRNNYKARGAISRPHLGQSAERLVVNSLQISQERDWRLHRPTDLRHQARTIRDEPRWTSRDGHTDSPRLPPAVAYGPRGYDSQFNPNGAPGGFNHPGYNQGVRLGAPSANSGRGFNHPGYNQGVRLGAPSANSGRGFNDPGYNQGVRLGAPPATAGRGFNHPQYKQGVRLGAQPANAGRGFDNPPPSPGTNHSSAWGRGAGSSRLGGELPPQDKDDGWIKVRGRRR